MRIGQEVEEEVREISEAFYEIKNTTTKKEKEEVIKFHTLKGTVVDTLEFLLNPFMTSNISSKKIRKKVKAEPERGFDSIGSFLNWLATDCRGSDKDIATIQEFIRGPHKEFLKQLVTKKFKLGCTAKTVNEVLEMNMIPVMEVMLAENYAKHSSYLDGKEFTITEKLDGIRCVAYHKGDGRAVILTRQGHPIEGLVEVEPEILSLPSHEVFDGELTAIDVPREEVYKATSKIVRKDGPKTDLNFLVFDCIPLEHFKVGKCKYKYFTRRDYFEKTIRDKNLQYVYPTTTLYVGDDQKKINTWLSYVVKQGGEGVMVNVNDAPYECKRTKNLLKVKEMHTVDLRINGWEEGQGRLKGTLGKLTVAYYNNTVGVGSGFSDAQREEIWKDPDSYIGKIIEVKYFEQTLDSRTKKPSLRFPVFMRVRDDKDEVSYA